MSVWPGQTDTGRILPDLPLVKDFDFTYAQAEPLSPLVTRVIARNPGPYTYTGSGTYIIGADDGPLAVIDPGPDLDEHLDAVVAACSGRTVSHILITHTHRDHCGGARRLSARLGAPVCAYGPHPVARAADDAPALDEGGDYAFRPDHILRDAETIDAPSWSLAVVHTPGHLSNHVCFALDAENALFTGDHVMGWATTVVAPPDGDMAAYLASLDRLLARHDTRYYPTHGAPIETPQRFVRAIRAHRLFRDGQIREQLSAGRATIAQMVAVMYASVDKRLHPAASLNVLAHLIRLKEIGEVSVDGVPRMDARWSLTEEGR